MAYHFLLVLLAACQEPAEEIILPDQESSFAKSSDLGNYLRNVSLLDGSADNVIDNASCLSVMLPVTVTVKGKPAVVESLSDIQDILEIYNRNPYDKDILIIRFPITVIYSDYTEIEVRNQHELEMLAAQCAEGGNDEDIECIDFEYPISIATYNLENQQAATHDISNDRSLHYLLEDLNEEDLIGIKFPVTIAAPAGSVTIDSNSRLEKVIREEAKACDEGDRKLYNPDLQLITEKITLTLTDAPFPVSMIAQANVTISKIDIKTGDNNDSIPFITLFNEVATFNLLELTNGITTLLSETEVPVGTYSFLRLFVEEASIQLIDQRTFDLQIPAGTETGIKLVPDSPIEIVEGKPAEYLLDFDLSASFIPRGNINLISSITGFNFVPVVRISNTSATGILKGMVANQADLPLEAVQVSVYAADTLNTTSFTKENGEFTILGLVPGSYAIVAEAVGYQVAGPKEINIVLGEITQYHFKLEQE